MKFRALTMSALVCAGAGGCADGAVGGNAREAVAATESEGSIAAAPTCEVVPGSVELPEEIRESSGLARGRTRADVLWTHNDGNRTELLGLGADGAVVARVHVDGITLEDWEDLGAGPCDSGNCLYLSDTGDNSGDRSSVTVYRIAEPAAGATSAGGAIGMQARYPDGRWDTEAIFVTADARVYLVTKGREGPVALYRFPSSSPASGMVVLERVRELFPASPAADDRITGAGISPDGRWVGIRSNSSIYFYPAAALLSGGPAPPTVIDLRPLGEPQGEALTIDPDGTVWLTSEAEDKDARPMLSRIQCTFPA